MKQELGNVVSDADGMKDIWRNYLENLLNSATINGLKFEKQLVLLHGVIMSRLGRCNNLASETIELN